MTLGSKQHTGLCMAWILSTGCLTAQVPVSQEISQESADTGAPFAARVVEGDKAAHKTKPRTGAQTVVEVRDAQGNPVAGANVQFQLPKAGPGGNFANSAQALSVETNASGRAATVGFTPNTDPGTFPLYIRVTHSGASQNLIVWQTNSNSRAGDGVVQPRSSWKWLVAGLAGAGAVVGIVLATRSGGSGDPGYRPGPPTVGAPR